MLKWRHKLAELAPPEDLDVTYLSTEVVDVFPCPIRALLVRAHE